MKVSTASKIYFPDVVHPTFSLLNNARRLLVHGKISGRDVWEMDYHPEFDKILEYKTLKVDLDTTAKLVLYVLIGKAPCIPLYEGESDVKWFEIALSQSKAMLEIWKDLNCV